MKKSKRPLYTRLATEEDKRVWLSVYAPIAFIGFVRVTESNTTHWAALIWNQHIGGRTKYTLRLLCDCHKSAESTQCSDLWIDVNCMTCIVRIEKGPSAAR